MGYAMKSNLCVLLFAVLLLPLFTFLSCSNTNSEDEITPPLSSTTPVSADKVPDSYLENNSWKRLSDTQFQTVWDAYDLNTQAYKKANLYQKDKKMGETKVYWDCPINKTGGDFILSYGLGLSTGIALTRRVPDYDAVYQSKENANLIRFYKRDEDGNVYESVHKNGWLVEVSEEKAKKSYVEIIEYRTDN